MAWSWSSLLLIIDAAICVVMLGVVPRKRPPISAMAWLLLIFLLPIIGLTFYLIAGRNLLPHRRMKAHRRMLGKIESVRRQFRHSPEVAHPDLGEGAAPFVRMAEKLGHLPILGGNAAELIVDSQEAIDRIIADIDAAERHAHVMFYIFQDDQTGSSVLEALYRAAARGVTCRLLVDAVGSRKLVSNRGDEIRARGIQLHAALPVGLFRRSVARLDVRNHRKVVVIDGRVGWTGSQNVINPDYGIGIRFDDDMVRLQGPIVMEMQHVFRCDWYFESEEMLDEDEIYVDLEPVGPIKAQLLPSGPNYPIENYQRMVLQALHSARRHAIVTTPYFVPDQALMQALTDAPLRGVQVDLVMPIKTDLWLADTAAHSYFEDLLDAGVTLHIYSDGNLHAKMISIDDDLAFLGSSNFDIRSFSLNFEVNLLFYGPEMVGAIRGQQLDYIARSRPLTLDEWLQRSRIRRFTQDMAKLFSPLL